MTSPAGGFNLGNAHGFVDIDASGVNRNLDSAQQAFNGFINQTSQQMQAWGRTIAGYGAQLSVLALPVAGVMNAGIDAAASFETIMTEIQARTGATTETMALIGETAKQLGADTVFSTGQAGEAFLNLLTAGLSVEQALAALPNVLNAAAAGSMDLGLAADYTTSIMANFQLTAEDTALIVESMSRASSASPATMQEMGDALNIAGSRAAQFGLDVTETSAILAIFAQNGRRGSTAGHELNSMLRNMSSDAKPTTEAWRELGISMYDAQGNMRDMDAIFADLRIKLDTLSDEDRNRIIQQLAGSEGAIGFNALLASDGVDAMVLSMRNQSSSTDIANAKMNTYKELINSMMGSLDALMITAFTPFMEDFLKPMIKQKIELINQIEKWVAANQPLVTSILRVLSAFLVLGPTLIAIGVGMQVIGGLLGVIGTAFAFVLSPIGLLIGAVSGLAYIFRDQLWDALEIGMNSIRSFMFVLQDSGNFIDAVAVGIARFVGDIARFFGMPANEALAMSQRVYRAFEAVKTTIGGFINTIRTGMRVFNDLIGRGLSPLTAIRYALISAFGNASFFNGLFAGLDRVVDAFSNVFEVIRNGFIFLFRGDIASLMPLMSSAIESDLMPLADVFFRLRGFATNAIEGIRNAFERIQIGVQYFYLMLNNGSSVFDAFKGGLMRAFGNADWLDFILTQFNNVRESITTTINRIVEVVRPAFDQISLFLQNNIGEIFGFVQAFMSIARIGSPIGQISLVLQALGLDMFTIFEGIVQGITRMFATLNSGGSFLDGIRAAFGDNEIFTAFSALMTSTVLPALNSVGNWFAGVLPWISDFIANSFIPAIGSIINILGNIWTIIGPALMTFGDWFLNTGLPAILTGLERFTGWLANIGAGDALKSFIDWVTAGLNQMGNDLATAGTAWDQLSFLIQWALTTAWTAGQQLWTLILLGLQGVTTWIGENWGPAWDGIVTFFQGLWTNVSGGFDSFKNGIQTAFQWIIDNVMPPLRTAWDGLVNFFTGLWGSVTTGIDAFKNGLDTAFRWISDNVITPVMNTVQDLLNLIGGVQGAAQNAANAASSTITNATNGYAYAGQATGQIGGMLASGQVNIGDVFNAFGNAFATEFGGSKDSGGSGEAGKAYFIGRGAQPELFIPQTAGTFVPNADRAGGSGGMNFGAGSVVINANSYREGREAARGFSDVIMERFRETN